MAFTASDHMPLMSTAQWAPFLDIAQGDAKSIAFLLQAVTAGTSDHVNIYTVLAIAAIAANDSLLARARCLMSIFSLNGGIDAVEYENSLSNVEATALIWACAQALCILLQLQNGLSISAARELSKEVAPSGIFTLDIMLELCRDENMVHPSIIALLEDHSVDNNVLRESFAFDEGGCESFACDVKLFNGYDEDGRDISISEAEAKTTECAVKAARNMYGTSME